MRLCGMPGAEFGAGYCRPQLSLRCPAGRDDLKTQEDKGVVCVGFNTPGCEMRGSSPVGAKTCGEALEGWESLGTGSWGSPVPGAARYLGMLGRTSCSLRGAERTEAKRFAHGLLSNAPYFCTSPRTRL